MLAIMLQRLKHVLRLLGSYSLLLVSSGLTFFSFAEESRLANSLQTKELASGFSFASQKEKLTSLFKVFYDIIEYAK